MVPLTGSLTSGQTLDHTFNLTWNNSLGFYNFNANNNSLNTSSFEGSVSWSTYGTIPNALEMRVQFLDDANIPVGTTITSKYSVAETSYYNFNMSSTTIPTSATRIGVMLYDTNNQLIDMKSSQIWVYS
ncbi:hypothetical protein D3C85_1604780 [compost metagenome]